MPTVPLLSRLKLSSLRFATHSGAARSLGVAPAVEQSFEDDHEMDSLVAATRLELGSRCLENGDYEGGVVAFAAVLQHVPHLAARTAEAQRGLLQCQKGLKLESLGAQDIDNNFAVEETLRKLGIRQWNSATPTPKAPAVRPTDDPTFGANEHSGSPATVSASEPGLDPESISELPRLSGLLEPEPEPELEPQLEQEGDHVLGSRSSLLCQVETLQETVRNLQAELVKKTAELIAMKSNTTAPGILEHKHTELHVSRGEAMRQEIKAAMKAEKHRRCAIAIVISCRP